MNSAPALSAKNGEPNLPTQRWLTFPLHAYDYISQPSSQQASTALGQVKVGRRNEKRWGLLFKCLTTRAIHIEVLSSINTDSFLMALRRFVSRRGKPAEILCDQGTNFRGGDRELQETFKALHPSLQSKLAEQQIKFRFNPPSSPHFGGSWEREIRSIKAALASTLGSQVVKEEILQTVLIEIENTQLETFGVRVIRRG